MRNLTTFFLHCAATAALAAGASAQCSFSSVSMTSNGQGCLTVFGTPPTVTGSFDASICSLTVDVTAFSGCCNTFLSGRILVLGLQPTNQPLPMVGPNCTLWVQPDAVVFLPATGGNPVALQLPPGLPSPFTLYAQGAALYFTTIGQTYDMQLTDGQTVTLQ